MWVCTSDLYQLEAPDWKGRAPYEFAQPVFSVENTEDKWYMGKVSASFDSKHRPCQIVKLNI